MSDSIKASLGRRIKTLRRENGLTQAKLALMINVEQSYLSKLELGSRNPQPQHALKDSRRLWNNLI